MIIDEKGRLFGLINIIDFMVILFLASLIPMIPIGMRIYRNTPKTTIETTIEIPIKEYEELRDMVDNLTVQLNSANSKIDSFLKEHKRARKYFK